MQSKTSNHQSYFCNVDIIYIICIDSFNVNSIIKIKSRAKDTMGGVNLNKYSIQFANYLFCPL